MTTGDLAVGIDFGGTKMLGAMVERNGTVVAEHRVPTPYDNEELLDTMRELVGVLEEQAGVCAVGVGVGAAGLVDRDGVFRFAPNVGGVKSLHVQKGMEERLPGRIVRVDNDNICATWGECLFGAGRGVQELAFVGLGTGIGGGIVTTGRLFRGENGFAGEMGHMTVKAGGAKCMCGRSGCWEAYASGRALGRMGVEAAAKGKAHRVLEIAGAVDDVRGEHVTRAAREGDVAALELMDEFARWVAVGVANLITVLDSKRIVIGGGMVTEADLFFDRMQEHLKKMIFGVGSRPEVPVVVAELGPRAGVVGASMLVYGDEIPEI